MIKPKPDNLLYQLEKLENFLPKIIGYDECLDLEFDGGAEMGFK